MKSINFEHHKTKHNANAYERLVISTANTQCESSFSTLNLSINSVTLVGQLLHVMDHACELTTYGKLLFTLVVQTTPVKLDSLTI